MKVEIEKGIPAPAKLELPSFDFLEEMEVGDSVFLAIPSDMDPTSLRQGLMRKVYKISSPSDEFKVTTRREGNGFRVWRIK